MKSPIRSTHTGILPNAKLPAVGAALLVPFTSEAEIVCPCLVHCCKKLRRALNRTNVKGLHRMNRRFPEIFTAPGGAYDKGDTVPGACCGSVLYPDRPECRAPLGAGAFRRAV